MLPASQPSRILAVTGTSTASTIAASTAAVARTSRASAAPLPRPTTFLTGHAEVDVDGHAPRARRTPARRRPSPPGRSPTSCAPAGADPAGKSSRCRLRILAAHHRLGGHHLRGHQAGAQLDGELAAGGVGDARPSARSAPARTARGSRCAGLGEGARRWPWPLDLSGQRRWRPYSELSSWISRRPTRVRFGSTASISGISGAKSSARPPGGDHPGPGPDLARMRGDDPLDQADVAEHETRLHRRRRAAPDHRRRRARAPPC